MSTLILNIILIAINIPFARLGYKRNIFAIGFIAGVTLFQIIKLIP